MSKDYKVGFGRPPRHTQFKPGQSGNPAGRPKGTKNLRTDLGEELAEKITVTENGRQLVISKQRAMLKSLLAKAMKGETAAARALINLIVGLEQADAQEPREQPLSAEDEEILEAWRQRLLDEFKEEGGEK
jgi:hypothetical protein